MPEGTYGGSVEEKSSGWGSPHKILRDMCHNTIGNAHLRFTGHQDGDGSQIIEGWELPRFDPPETGV